MARRSLWWTAAYSLPVCQTCRNCIERVCRVFGVHSVSPAWELDKDMDEIYAQAEKLMEGRTGTFKIEARRSDKRFPLDSMEIGREVGH